MVLVRRLLGRNKVNEHVALLSIENKLKRKNNSAKQKGVYYNVVQKMGRATRRKIMLPEADVCI